MPATEVPDLVEEAISRAGQGDDTLSARIAGPCVQMIDVNAAAHFSGRTGNLLHHKAHHECPRFRLMLTHR